MRKETKRKIVSTLVTSGPMTARDLATMTGLAYNTVRTALTEIEAIRDASYPAEWSIEAGAVVDNIMSKAPDAPSIAKSDTTLSIDLEEREAWVEEWNRSIPKVAKLVEKLQIYPKDSPKVLIEQLQKLIVPMAGLAYALQQHTDSPDWFIELGGIVGPHKVS